MKTAFTQPQKDLITRWISDCERRTTKELMDAVRDLMTRDDLDIYDTKAITGYVKDIGKILDEDKKFRHTWLAISTFISGLSILARKYGYACEKCKKAGKFPSNICQVCLEK